MKLVAWSIGLVLISAGQFPLSLWVRDTWGQTAQLCFLPISFAIGFVYGWWIFRAIMR